MCYPHLLECRRRCKRRNRNLRGERPWGRYQRVSLGRRRMKGEENQGNNREGYLLVEKTGFFGGEGGGVRKNRGRCCKDGTVVRSNPPLPRVMLRQKSHCRTLNLSPSRVKKYRDYGVFIPHRILPPLLPPIPPPFPLPDFPILLLTLPSLTHHSITVFALPPPPTSSLPVSSIQ